MPKPFPVEGLTDYLRFGKTIFYPNKEKLRIRDAASPKRYRIVSLFNCLCQLVQGTNPDNKWLSKIKKTYY